MPSSPRSAGNQSPLKQVMAAPPCSTWTASSLRTGSSMNLRSSMLIAGYPSSDFTSACDDLMALAMPRLRTGANHRPAGSSSCASAIGGSGFTYTALDLVMAANDCDLDTAFKFLSDHTGWVSERAIFVDAATVLGPAPTEEQSEEQAKEQAKEPAKAPET